MSFRFGDKFFLIWVIMILNSYEPSKIDTLIMGGASLMFAITWEYFHDLKIFQLFENKIQYLKEEISFLHKGYRDDSR